MSFAKRLSLLLSVFLIPLAANAQQNITSTDQAAAGRANAEQNRLQEQQRQANRRDAAVSAPGTRSAAPAQQGWPELTSEKLCFKIQTFVLEVPRALPAATRAAGASSSPFDRFTFAREWLEHYRGQCVGRQGLDMLVKGVQGEILSRGYVTTRVLLPPQDLSTGVLKFALVPGMIRHLKFADAATRGTWVMPPFLLGRRSRN